jgi:hypothetical protein
MFICTHPVHRMSRQCLDGDANGEPDVIAPPPRQATPLPDGPLVSPDDLDHEIWNVSSSDVVPVDEDWPMTPPGISLVH